MARGRELSPAYAKRIASALARGKTRQQARGHRTAEHVERREREIAEFGISSQQAASIRTWVEHSFNPLENKEIDAEDVIEEVRAHDWDWYVQWRDTWWRARRQYLREVKAGTYATRGLGYLEYLTGEAGVEDISWLYYH